MSRRLHSRITNMGGNRKAAQAGFTPVAPAGAPATTGSMASPGGTPAAMPLAQVLVYPAPDGQYSTIAYRGLAPIYTDEGAAVPATSPGRWGQLAAAGRP